jgi:hypothetical protein
MTCASYRRTTTVNDGGFESASPAGVMERIDAERQHSARACRRAEPAGSRPNANQFAVYNVTNRVATGTT